MSHFTGRDPTNTGALLRQSVPVERIFMSFLETVQMNRQFKEAEAILLYDEDNKMFWLFGNWRGRACMWGCFAGFTRKTPPHLPFAPRNPKEPMF